MYKTLSLRNASRQAKDYLIYFITMTISVALIYAFNGLIFSGEVTELASIMSSLPVVIIAASLVMVMIIGWLVAYTINFILHKRSKELGTYMLLGIEQKQVAKMFFIENILISGVALVLGIILGNLMYQLVYSLVMYTFGVPFSFTFTLSLGTIALTLIYFACIYVFALFRSRKQIAKMKIYDLLHYDKINEAKLLNARKNRTLLFVVSLLAGILGLLCIVISQQMFLLLIGCILLIFFLYSFFISVSSFTSTYLSTHPASKYQGNKLFILRTLLSKISTMSVTLATLSLLFSVALGAIGSGMLFSKLFDVRIEEEIIFDMAITSDHEDFTNYLDYLNTSTIDIASSHQYTIYQSDTRDITNGIEDRGEDLADYDKDSIMRISDYNVLREMLDLSPVTLENGKYILHCEPNYVTELEDYVADNTTFTLQQKTLSIQEIHSELFYQSGWFGNGNGALIVVPDNMVTSQPVEHYIYAAMTDKPIMEEEFIVLQEMAAENDYSYAISKEVQRILYTSSYIIFVFPLYYIALIVLMVAATILSIQHLSEIAKNKYRYDTLSKLGVPKTSLLKIMRQQLGIYFILPALPALLISADIIYAFSKQFDDSVFPYVLPMMGLTFIIFFLVYAIYILATYTSFKRNVID